MLKNYLKVAFRNLVNNKVYSVINIGGLTLGIATALLILLWVGDELSYDRYHTNADRLFRTVVLGQVADQEVAYTTTPAPFAELASGEIPEIQSTTRVNLVAQALFTHEQQPFQEPDGAYADPAMLTMFSFNFIEGDPATALIDPKSVVLSQTLARKYFGDEPAVGQTLRLNNADDVTVRAVYADMPKTSHLRFAYLLPFELFVQNRGIGDDNWSDFNYYTYLQLADGALAETVGDKITSVLNKKFEDDPFVSDIFLQPITDIHLHSNYSMDISGNGDIQYVYIFSAIGLFILIIACINFMNLATARSIKRSKEIGLRKTVGAVRPQLIRQFLGEALLYSFIAVALAALLVKFVLPLFNDLAQKQVYLHLLDGRVLGLLAIITLVTGILAGLYPALFLSSFKPAKVLKGTFRVSSGSALFRKGLVVLQFALSIILIVGTLVINDQLSFIRNKKLGYSKDNTLVLPMSGDIGSSYLTFKNRLLEQPGIRYVTSASQDLTDVSSTTNGADWPGAPEDGMLLSQLSVDRDFIDAFGIQMADGRAFSSERNADSTAFILNQAAVKMIGADNPVGLSFSVHGVEGTVVGVAEDFNFQSVRQAIAPMVLFVSPNWRNKVYIKVEPDQLSEAITTVEDTWKQMNPAYPFEYRFLDESFDELYRAEQRTGELFNYFALIAIFISCLGLFGLSAYTAELRTKEIGVRKVLGASVPSILALFTKDFLILVLLAFALAVPVSYYLMHTWLQGFVYRTSIGLTVFALAITFAVLITLLTVSYQSLRAALANPVDSLRSE
ncbi:MAG: ABC transporter permease [Tunicatimonas sp.]